MFLRELEVGRLQGQEPFVVKFHDPMHLCDLFLRILGKYPSGKAVKVAIDFVDSSLTELNGFAVNQDVPDCHLNVVMLSKTFQFEIYDNASDVGVKKMMIWEGLFSSLKLCCEKFGWDQQPIVETYKKGIEQNMVNEYFFKEAKKSPNRKYSGRVFCEFDIDSFKSYAVFFDVNGLEVGRKLLLNESPSFGWYDAYNFKQTKWLSDDEFALIDKFGNKWSAGIG